MRCSEIGSDDTDDAFLLAIATAGDTDFQVIGNSRSGLLQRGNLD
jgi:predicted nucleic acid-binding protein